PQFALPRGVVDRGVGVLAAGLQQQHFLACVHQPAREDRPGRSSTHHDRVIALGHLRCLSLHGSVFHRPIRDDVAPTGTELLDPASGDTVSTASRDGPVRTPIRSRSGFGPSPATWLRTACRTSSYEASAKKVSSDRSASCTRDTPL